MLTEDYFEVPDAGVVLFHSARSYCAQQVRLALVEKGIAWTSRPLDLAAAEQFAPAYVRINPDMVVPTLADRGRVVRNSARIIRFIDLRFDGAQLCPDDPAMIDRIDWLIDAADSVPVKAISATRLPKDLRARQVKSWYRRMNVLQGLMDEHVNDSNLSSIYRRKHTEIAGWCAAAEHDSNAEAAIRRTELTLDRLEDVLDGPYLAGAGYSLADVAWTPILGRLVECDLETLWIDGRRPRLADYVVRVMSRPSFDAAITAYLDGRRQ